MCKIKKQLHLEIISIFFLIFGCASTCMEYRSATTAARTEKDLARAEEWGLKALASPECNSDTNAWVPYFLAKEVYLQQKKYIQMAEMLSMAEQINPSQQLELPYKLGDKPIETIAEGVSALREVEWIESYNKAIGYKNKNKMDKAKSQIEIAMLIHPLKAENYSTLAYWNLEENNNKEAIFAIDRGLQNNNNNPILLQMKADILVRGDFPDGSVIDEKLKKELILLFKSAKEGNDVANYDLKKNYNLDITNYSLEAFKLKLNTLSEKNPKLSSDLVKLENAKELYLKSIEFSDDPGPIMRKLLFVYIDLNENKKAIDYSNELLDKYPNDPDLYYNVGVLYQRLTLDTFDPVRELFLSTTEESPAETIREVYNSFVTARKYAYNSKDYFLQATDLELDDNISTHEAVNEMRTLMDQIDEIFIPSIRATAKNSGINLE